MNPKIMFFVFWAFHQYTKMTQGDKVELPRFECPAMSLTLPVVLLLIVVILCVAGCTREADRFLENFTPSVMPRPAPDEACSCPPHSRRPKCSFAKIEFSKTIIWSSSFWLVIFGHAKKPLFSPPHPISPSTLPVRLHRPRITRH